MPQEMKIQEALRLIIRTKKTLYDFYLLAAERVTNPLGRKVFQRLAEEVHGNLGRFFHLYNGHDLGDFDQFMALPPSPDAALIKELTAHPDIHERRAQELALSEEEDIERMLRMTAARVIDPAARQTLERAAHETRQHCALIESEYAHTMGMVHETDIDIYVRE
ncbi:hypothetical protein [Geothermobacter hydrogeniphilus]|uniref:Rubrerythrin n=1 Tax=Geothermobacter hydrogeniphilus TaxID=1969733 RepID=A0A1X0YA86_9BACT|nr:hypothetical protein [Geothermobacter hydrogeniphilus]ORJ62088.1 hypothetical protein B5V00_04875 [Geothermobacter hydrogeniphilus]